MLLPVPGGVLGRVLQAEVGRQVDHRPDGVGQHRHQGLGDAVGQGAKDEVEPVEEGRVGRLVDEGRVDGGERGRPRGHGGPRHAPGGGHHHLELLVLRTEAQELRSRVARGAHDPGLHRNSIQTFAYPCVPDELHRPARPGPTLAPRSEQAAGRRRRTQSSRTEISVPARMLTARDTTSATVSSEASDWTIIRSFAQGVSGIVSVGLNAVTLVKDT